MLTGGKNDGGSISHVVCILERLTRSSVAPTRCLVLRARSLSYEKGAVGDVRDATSCWFAAKVWRRIAPRLR